MNYTVQVDTGSGYQTLVHNEDFKIVPYAKMAERLRPSNYDVVTNKHNIQAINDGSGSFSQGFKLSHGSDDWYMYMKSNNDFAISNDGTDAMTISDSDNSVWMKTLKINSSAAGANAYRIHKGSDGLFFDYYYSSAWHPAMKLHGTASVEIPGKLRAPASGNADMKAYIYGEILTSGGLSYSSSSDGFTASRISSGHYRIKFDNPISTSVYFPIITVFDSSAPQIATYITNNNFFDVYIWNKDGNPVSSDFSFVVYKK